jgi:PAS domain S-box-containing protein
LKRKGRNFTDKRKPRGFREREQLQQARHEYEKYRTVVEDATDFIYLIDKKDRVLSVNKSAAALFGRTGKEIEGKSIFDIFPKEVATQFSEHLSEVFKTGKGELNHDSRMVVGGKEFWTSVRLDPVMDKEGRVLAVLGVTRDITELKRTREQYKTIVQTAMDGFWRTDCSGRFLDMNDAYCDTIGYSRAELLKMRIQDVEAKESAEETAQHIKIIMETGSDRFETRHRRKDGKLIDIEVSTNYLPFDGGQLVVFLRDITERKRAEEKLRASESKYRTLFENIPHGIYQSTRDGRILTVNPALVRMLGYGSESELLAADMARDIYVNPNDRKAWMRRLEEGGELYNAELVLKRKNGQELIALDSGHVVRDEQGRTLYYEGTITDITQRKRMEDELRRRALELNALQETVLDITGRHDLSTLLNSIVERAARLLDAPSGGMYVCDRERRDVRCVVGYNTLTNPVGTVLKYGEGAAGIVAETAKPLIIDDYRTWPGRATAFERDQPFRTVLSVPMIWQGQVTGVIHILDNKETRRFTQADLELSSTFANHAAVAVENARLLELEQRHAEELTRYSRNLEEQVLERTRKLAESERRFRELADLLPQIVFEMDDEGYLTFLNNIGSASTGYCQDEFRRGLTAFQMFIPEEHDRARLKMRKLLSGEKVSGGEYTILRKDGSTFPAVVYAAPIMREDRAVGVRGIVVDITERKRIEEALRVSEERFRGIAERSFDAIFTTNDEGCITYASPAAERISGYACEEVLGKTFRDFVAESEIPKLAQQSTGRRKDELVAGLEIELRRKDGSSASVEMNASPILRDGQFVGMQGIARDITERKRMEKRLQEAERMAAIGETAAMVGHDLRNPLQGIAVAVYLLKQGSLRVKERDEMLQLIQESIERADAIVKDLSDYSVEIQLKLAEATPKSIITGAIEAVKIPRNVTVHDLSKDQPRLRLDSDRMSRLFINLIENAVDAMPQGGVLAISSKQSDESVEIAIADTGTGMPEKVMQNLWKPLQTTKAKGLGLGLAVCKRIVDAHGGSIAVKNEAGEGTTVTIRLPIKPDEAEVAQM